MKKTIVFLTSGTRGDVQPISVLARGLQEKGYPVRVAAPSVFREIVESQSVPFAPLEGNPSDLLTSPGSQSALTFNNSPMHGIKSALGYLKAAKPVYAKMIENGWHASQDASALVIGLPTIWGTSIAEKLNIPCIGAFLQPSTSTSEFPSPLLPSTIRLGKIYNYLTYWLISQIIYLPWRKVINAWREKSLELSQLPFFYNHFEQLDAIIYGFSNKVVKRPKDWGQNNFITGYWLENNEHYSPTQELKSFLTEGEKPFYFGFGSPGIHEPKAFIQLLLTAIEKSKIRAVLSLPKEYQIDNQNKNIFVQNDNIPHSWLFPQMAGLIHHGGAGTTAEALKSGVPSFITPLAVDQFFWGEKVFELGVGPRAMPQRELTVEKLVDAVEKMKTQTMKENAKKLGESLRAEDGVSEAVKALENILNQKQVKGQG